MYQKEIRSNYFGDFGAFIFTYLSDSSHISIGNQLKCIELSSHEQYMTRTSEDSIQSERCTRMLRATRMHACAAARGPCNRTQPRHACAHPRAQCT